MNIAYRVVHAVLAAAVFPAIIFLQLFYIEISPDFIDYGISLEFSIYKIFDLFGGGSDTSSLRDAFSSESLSNIWGVFASDRAAFIMMIASAALTLVITVFILVFSIAKGTRKVLLPVSAAGLVTSILFKIFSNHVCKSVIAGDVNIVSLFTKSYIGAFLGDLVNVDTFRIGAFSNAVTILFICMVLWSVTYIITDIGLEEEKPASPAKKK